jgi:hypothetical protein
MQIAAEDLFAMQADKLIRGESKDAFGGRIYHDDALLCVCSDYAGGDAPQNALVVVLQIEHLFKELGVLNRY